MQGGTIGGNNLQEKLVKENVFLGPLIGWPMENFS